MATLNEAEGTEMYEKSLYESEPGVPPVRVVSLRALRARAKRGRFETEVPVWPDFFELLAERPESRRG